MSSLDQAVGVLTAAHERLQALRSTSEALVTELPDVSEEGGRKELHRIVTLLGSNLQALKAAWKPAEQALRLASPLPPPLSAAAAATSAAGVLPEAAQQYVRRDDDASAMVEVVHWCRTAGRQLEEGLSLHLGEPFLADAQRDHGAPAAIKRQKLAVGEAGAGADTAAELGRVLERVRQATSAAMSIHACSAAGGIDVPLRDAAELRVVCPRVFCCSIVLGGGSRHAGGGLQVVRIMMDEAGAAAKADGWTTTEHQLFRRVAALATRAVTYFAKRAAAAQVLHALPNSSPESVALEDLLLWVAGYQGLFIAPCCATGRLMALDLATKVPLPPIFRPFKRSRGELLHMAKNPTAVRAYHMHAAPADELGWADVEDASAAAH